MPGINCIDILSFTVFSCLRLRLIFLNLKKCLASSVTTLFTGCYVLFHYDPIKFQAYSPICLGEMILVCVILQFFSLENKCDPPAENESHCYPFTFCIQPLSQRGSMYRFRLFNELSFSSLFYIRKIHLLHIRKGLKMSLVSV